MVNRIIDKFSNYKYYSTDPRLAVPVAEERLLSLIGDLRGTLKKPYLRFMWMSQDGETDALAVLYNNGERLTKLLPLHAIEQMALNASYTR